MQARGLRRAAADPDSVPGRRLPAPLGTEPCLHSHASGHRPLAPRARLGGAGRRGGRTVLQPRARGALPAALGAIARLRSQPWRERLAAALARARGLPGTGRRGAAVRPGSGRARHVARADGHGRDGWAIELPRSGQQLLELLTATLPRDNDLALLHVPHQQPADARMAAEQRVAGPHRSGERLGQLALAAAPAGKLALLRVLERHRGDAAPAAAAPEKRTSAVAASHRSRSSHTPCSANSSRRPG